MSEETKIEWATHTWNPWEGCTKVSPGCKNCYAETRNHRFKLDNWGKGKPRRRTSAANWRKPHKWNTEVEAHPDYRARVFPSLCDWLDDEVPIEWLADFLKLIHDTPNLDWLLLTKRPENWGSRLAMACHDWGAGLFPPNVWIGVSVEDQQRADERIPELLKIPAALHFLSVEPLLEEVDLKLCKYLGAQPANAGHVDWVIAGGESGPSARPCHSEWVGSILGQCRMACVPVFVKQLGPHVIAGDGQRINLKHKKGGDPSEWPQDLRVREFP